MADYQLLGDGFGYHPSYGSTGNAANNNPGGPNLGPGMGPGGPQSVAANSALMAQMMSSGAVSGGPGYPGMMPPHGSRTHGIPQRSLGFGPPLPMPPGSSGPSPGSLSGPSSLGDAAKMHDQYASSGYGGVQSSIRGGNYPTHDSRYGHSISGYPMSMGGGPVGPSSLGPMSQHNGGIPPQASMASLQGPNSYQTRGLMSGYSDQRMLTPSPYSSPYGPTGPGGSSDLWHNQGISHVQQRAPYGYGGGSAGIPPQPSSSVHGSRGGPAPSSFGPPSSDYGSLHSQQSKSSQGQPPHSQTQSSSRSYSSTGGGVATSSSLTSHIPSDVPPLSSYSSSQAPYSSHNISGSQGSLASSRGSVAPTNVSVSNAGVRQSHYSSMGYPSSGSSSIHPSLGMSGSSMISSPLTSSGPTTGIRYPGQHQQYPGYSYGDNSFQSRLSPYSMGATSGPGPTTGPNSPSYRPSFAASSLSGMSPRRPTPTPPAGSPMPPTSRTPDRGPGSTSISSAPQNSYPSAGQLTSPNNSGLSPGNSGKSSGPPPPPSGSSSTHGSSHSSSTSSSLSSQQGSHGSLSSHQPPPTNSLQQLEQMVMPHLSSSSGAPQHQQQQQSSNKINSISSIIASSSSSSSSTSYYTSMSGANSAPSQQVTQKQQQSQQQQSNMYPRFPSPSSVSPGPGSYYGNSGYHQNSPSSWRAPGTSQPSSGSGSNPMSNTQSPMTAVTPTAYSPASQIDQQSGQSKDIASSRAITSTVSTSSINTMNSTTTALSNTNNNASTVPGQQYPSMYDNQSYSSGSSSLDNSNYTNQPSTKQDLANKNVMSPRSSSSNQQSHQQQKQQQQSQPMSPFNFRNIDSNKPSSYGSPQINQEDSGSQNDNKSDSSKLKESQSSDPQNSSIYNVLSSPASVSGDARVDRSGTPSTEMSSSRGPQENISNTNISSSDQPQQQMDSNYQQSYMQGNSSDTSYMGQPPSDSSMYPGQHQSNQSQPGWDYGSSYNQNYDMSMAGEGGMSSSYNMGPDSMMYNQNYNQSSSMTPMMSNQMNQGEYGSSSMGDMNQSQPFDPYGDTFDQEPPMTKKKGKGRPRKDPAEPKKEKKPRAPRQPKGAGRGRGRGARNSPEARMGPPTSPYPTQPHPMGIPGQIPQVYDNSYPMRGPPNEIDPSMMSGPPYPPPPIDPTMGNVMPYPPPPPPPSSIGPQNQDIYSSDPAANSMPPLGPPPSHEMERMSNEMMYPQHEPNSMGSESSEYKPITGDSTISYDSQPLPPSIPQTQIQQSSEEQPAQHQSDLTYNQNADDPVSDQLPTEQPSEDNSKIAQNDLINQPYSLASETGNVNNNEITRVVDSNIDSNTCSNNFDDPSLKSISNDESLLGITGNENLKQVASPSSIDQRQEQQQQELTKQDSTTLLDQSFPSQTSAPPPPIEVPQLLPPPPELPPTISESACEEGIVISKLEFNEEQTSSSTPVKRKGKKRKPKDDIVPFEGDPFMSTEGHQTFFSEDGQEAKKKKRKKKKKPEGETINEVIEGVEASGVGEDGQEKPKKKRKKKPKKKPEEEENITKPVGEDNDPIEKAENIENVSTTNYQEDTTIDDTQNIEENIFSESKPAPKKKSKKSKPKLKDASSKNKKKLPKLALKFGKAKKRKRLGSSDASDIEKTPPPSPEDPESASLKRRSARNTKRQKYTDDIDLDLSEEDSDLINKLAEAGSIDSQKKLGDNNVQVTAITEDTMVVDKIMASRMAERELEIEEGEENNGGPHKIQVEEYYVKYKNLSYLHCEWKTEDELESGDKRVGQKIKRWKQKKESEIDINFLEDEPFNPDYTEVDRILDVTEIEDVYEEEVDVDDDEDDARSDTKVEIFPVILGENGAPESKKEIDSDQDKHKAASIDTEVTIAPVAMPEITEPKVELESSSELNTGSVNELGPKSENECKPEAEDPTLKTDNIKEENQHKSANDVIADPTSLNHSKKLADSEISSSQDIEMKDSDLQSTKESNELEGVTSVEVKVHTVLPIDDVDSIKEESKNESSDLSEIEKPQSPKSSKEDTMEIEHKVDEIKSDANLDEKDKIEKFDNSNEEKKETNIEQDETKTETRKKKKITKKRIVRHYLVKWRALPYEESTWELEDDLDPLKIAHFWKFKSPPPKDKWKPKKRPKASEWKKLNASPDYKSDNTLREYQLEGVNWLMFCWHNGRNCILADEMGLGKTIQSIAFVQEMFKQGITGPFLIIVPLSTIGNWQREFETWTDLNVITYHGSSASRNMLQEYEMYYKKESGERIEGIYKFQVMITTFEIVLTDCLELREISWRTCIIDEAHRLKNRNCKLLEGLRLLNMEHRVLLTGTPLQNNVEELFSLLNFLEPAQFASSELFLSEFGDLKTEDQVDKLKALLKPMMLRRLKEDVEKSLAPKEETIIEVELTNVQKKYYRAILERNFQFLTKGNTKANIPNLMNTMMELRKCCIHPYLINGAEEQILLEYRQNKPDSPTFHLDALVHASGKLVLIDKLLPRLKANGHRVLIFSQMVRCLDILEDYLCQKRYPFERIDGRVRGNMRQAAIDRFSKPDSDRFVFLLCTRAGGLGINLTAADTVIIFDSDWNPQNDLQAQARCHRIGQSKMVKVYRLICRNTYEREMFDKASLKLGLDRAVLQSMNTSGALTGDAGNGLSKKEVEDLLRKGAYGAIMDDDNAGDKFCEEDIEQILQRRTQVITLESEEKGSTFSKASFAASDNRSDIEIDDPNFWEKWAKKAQLDVDELTGKNELIVQEPRRRTQTKRFGQDDAMLEISEGDSSDEDDADVSTRTRGGKTKLKLKKGKRGREREDEFMEDFAPGNWTKAECYQVEKGLLSYGWGRWDKFLEMGIFKRHLTLKDIEHVARVIMLHCLQNFRGDEKKKETSFYWDIITPSQPKDDEQKSVKVPLDDEALSPPSTKKRGKRSKNQPPPPPSLPPSSLSQPDRPLEFYEWIKEDIYNPDLLLPEDYRNHVTKIANKILLRFKLLWYLKTEIFGNICDQIIRGISCREASFSPPCKDGYPGMPGWWDEDADKSLLMGVFKHGYDRYNLMRQDPALCFLTRCGPPDGAALMAELQSTEDPTKDEDDEIDTPLTSSSTLGDLRRDQIRETSAFGEEFMPFPSSSDLNRRFRNLISAYQRNVKKLERLEKLERFEAAVREKENKRREAAQRKWSKREEADFYRTIVSYGVEYNQISKRYDWSRFRILSKLDRKIDESLTEYYKTFHAMCKKVTGRPLTDEEENYSSIIDPISEEKASRALARIELLNKIREEILPHPELDERLSLCQNSIDLPDWWICGKHDKDLLIGTAKYGLSRLDINLRNDPDLSFSSILTNQDFLTKAKFEKQLPEEVVKENLPNVECETKLSESVPETQDGHNTQKEEKEDKKGASQEDKLVNNEKESEQENCEKLNQVDSKTIDEEPKNSEKFDDFEIKKEEEPMPLTKTEESVSEGKSGVVDNEIEKMEVDENAADFKQQLEPKTKDTDATEDEKDANISISENKSSQREDEDVKTSSQIERANESTQDEDNSDRKEIKVQSEEESEKETNKISVEEKDDPMENDANESKELKADKKKTVDNDDKQKEEESDDDTNKTKHASDQVVKKEEEISDNSKKEISDKDDKSSCEIEEKVVNEDLPTIKEENSTTSDTKSQETANNSNILTLLESDTNYLTQSNINFARRDPWPKERVLQVRLEHVCYCVEKGEWPTSKMNISSVSGTVPSTPSIATADSSPRAASPESISSMSREPTPHQTPTNTPRHESVSPPPDPFLFNPDNALGIMETLPRSTRTRGRRRRRYELESNDRARLRNLLSQPDVITTSSKKTMHTPPSTSSMMTSNASFLPPLFTLSFQNFRNELAAAAAASAEDTKGSSLLLRESGLNQARSKPVGSTSSPLLPPPASIKTPLSSITNPLGKASSKSQGAPPPAHQNSSKSKRNPNLDTMDLTFGHAPKPLPGQQPMTPANKPFSPPDKLVKESSSPSDPSSVLDLSGPPKKDSDRKGGSRSDALAGLTSSGSSALGGKSKTGKRIGRRIDDLATNLLRQKKMLVEKQDDVPVKESKLTPPPREAKPRSELDKVDTRTSTIPKDRTRTPPAAHSSSHSSTLSAALTRDLSMKAPEKSNFLPPKGLSSSSRSRDTSSTASSSTAHHSTTFDTNLKSNLPKLDLSFSEQAAALKKFLDEHPELLSNPTFATAALALSGNSSIPANTQLLELPESRKRSSRGRPKSDQHLTAPATAIGQTSSSNTIPNIQNLTGDENVPVINRISGKKLSGSKAPTLKQLPDWLKKNPMFDIDPKWAAMMREKFPMFKSPTPQPTSNSGSSSGSIRTRTSDRKSVESSNTKSSSSASGSRRATASSLLAASQANNSTTSSTSTTPSNPTSSSFGFPPSSLNPLGFNPSLLSSYPFNKMFMDPTGLISSAASSSSSTSTNSRGNASSGTSSSTTTTSTTTNPMFFPFGGLASMGLGNPLLGLPGFNFPGLGPGFNPLSIPGLGNETKKSDKGSSSSGNQDKSKNNSDKSGGKGKGGSNAKNLNDPSSIYNSLPFLYPNPNLLYNPLGLSGFSLPGSPFASLAAQSGLMNGLGGLGLGSTSSTSTTTSTSSTSHAKSSSHSKSKETKSVSRPNLISPSLPKQSTPKPSPSPASIKSPTNIPSTISQTASLSASNLPSRDLITTPIATGLSTISGMIDSDDESLKSLMGQEDDEDDLNGDLEDLNENLDTDTDVEHGGNGDAGSKKSKPKSSPRPPSSHSSIKSPPMTTETKNSARRGSTSSNATIENETTKDSAT